MLRFIVMIFGVMVLTVLTMSLVVIVIFRVGGFEATSGILLRMFGLMSLRVLFFVVRSFTRFFFLVILFFEDRAAG